MFVLAGYRDSSALRRSCRSASEMVYRALWGVIPAGEAVIEVLPDVTIDGVKAHHFAMTTTTNSKVDVFYKVRERQDSYADIQMTRTLQYRKKSAGNHPRDVVVLFDWKNRTATYASFGNAETREILRAPSTAGTSSSGHRAGTDRDPHHRRQEKHRRQGSVGGGRHYDRRKDYDTFLVIPDMDRLQGLSGAERTVDKTILRRRGQVPVRIQRRWRWGVMFDWSQQSSEVKTFDNLNFQSSLQRKKGNPSFLKGGWEDFTDSLPLTRPVYAMLR
jgi:hypothetical protein